MKISKRAASLAAAALATMALVVPAALAAGQPGQTVELKSTITINERAMLALLRAVIANNRAGGWRKLQQQ